MPSSSYLTQFTSTVTLLFNTPLVEPVETPREFQLKEMPAMSRRQTWRESSQLSDIQGSFVSGESRIPQGVARYSTSSLTSTS
ncbi:hypothetical protein D9758_007120 [Tetrapyrgos nigripes]|uniref:Uncharacterized protein n=1 Tax=Tetrapyrgos nigripes TaxID=182062 RepID=A0A8H5GDH8_9AGAR|nr:hypothetical protein D9758_007120 [Tetrapyrgos nigripes]